MKSQNKILIHACCGVCFAYPILLLKDMGYEPAVYYFNPNIFPANEFERRYIELEKYCLENNVEIIKEEYNHEYFLEKVRGFETEPEKGKRCAVCFYNRLKMTAKRAFELKIPKITTTLSVSPHKISKIIFEEGKQAAKEYGVEFLEIDFKKKDGFKKTSEIAYSLGMYRQNYCGCEFSIIKT